VKPEFHHREQAVSAAEANSPQLQGRDQGGQKEQKPKLMVDTYSASTQDMQGEEAD